MTNEQAKETFLKQVPVTANGVTYKCISAIINRIEKGRVVMYCELTDRNVNSVTITPPKWVNELSEENNNAGT